MNETRETIQPDPSVDVLCCDYKDCRHSCTGTEVDVEIVDRNFKRVTLTNRANRRYTTYTKTELARDARRGRKELRERGVQFDAATSWWTVEIKDGIARLIVHVIDDNDGVTYTWSEVL